MTPGLARVIVNGLLFGIAAITLFPLVWMVAVSLMSAGEASTYPPPLVPSHPTFACSRTPAWVVTSSTACSSR